MQRSRAGLWIAIALLGAACAPAPGPIEREGGTQWRTLSLRLGADPEPAERIDPVAFDAAPNWIEASVPDFWPLARRARNDAAWYRARVDLPVDPPRDWAVAVDGHWSALAVYCNGERIGFSSAGERSYPASITSRGSLLLPLPPESLRAGSNQILLHYRSLPDEIGAVSWIAVGPREALVREQKLSLLRRQTVPSALLLLGVASGALVIGVSRYSPIPGVAWLGAAAVLWCLANLLAPLAPRPASFGGWITSLAGHAFVPCAAVGLHRTLGIVRRRVEAFFVVTLVAGAIGRALAPPLLVPVADNLWWAVNLGIAIYMVPLGVRSARRGLLPAPYLLFPAIGILALAGLHDFASLFAGRSLLGSGSLVNLTHPLIALTAAGALVTAIARALREARVLNLELEQRVEEKHRELEASYARTAELERDRAVAAERERMMRDMHDGTGGQLVSALSLVETGEFRSEDLAETLRDALADLRLAIDSLDAGEADLLVLLAQARARLEPRLEPHGVRFAWEVEDVPTPSHFGPEQTLHVLRVLQEAVTNVLKHAHAKVIRVRTGQAIDAEGRACVWIEIADDGCGLRDDAAAPRGGGGRGLRNMRRRAAEIGGAIDVSSDASGTRVRLSLPLLPR